MSNWDASQLLRGIEQAASRMQTGAKRGLGDWGEHVLDEAVRIVPIEEGTLQNSGTVAQSSDGMTVGVGFGDGAAAPYAVKQHEDFTLRHNGGRQAKYLEIPLQASKSIGFSIVADAIENEIR